MIITILITYCAPYKMKAIRAERDHRHDLDIKYSMKHHNSHSNDESVISRLNNAGGAYYQDVQKKFSTLKDWINGTPL